VDLADAPITPEAARSPTARDVAPRYHSLDALRAVALLLGILLHAGLAYLPGPGIGWAVQDRSTHVLFGAGILVLHSFRLEIFFLLAGFFARLLFERRGPGGFVLNRMLRVLVPFAVGWFLVFPGLAFAWIWGGMKGDPAAIGAALRIAAGAPLSTLVGLWHAHSLRAHFPLTHLWFLYYLLLVYGLFFTLRSLAFIALGRDSGWLRGGETFARGLLESKWTVLVLGLVTWGTLLPMRSWGVDTPDKTFWPHVPALLLFGLFFSIGWLLHRQAALLEVLRQRWWPHLVSAVLLSLPVLILIGFEGQKEHAHYREIRSLYLLAYALMMWSWVFALVGIFLRFRDQESPFWRYLSDSSYWLYIIHLPVAVLLQVALFPSHLPCGIKFGLVSAGTILFSLATYHYVVRWTFIGQVLNGRRYSFCWH
jgi:peptidoglycan/LPS O-acetylase OafA/YrhL